METVSKVVNVIFQRSTFALVGAILIHLSLGTVYTLSNVNSYMTSYMRKHGSPSATYGSSTWLSSANAIGQGISMVLGGYIEKHFSARLSCFLGCAIHSSSIIASAWSLEYGPKAILLTYGLLPGFGCGLAYMTPISNGFGWFPKRRGLVAGTISAGFGMGTFIFNMVQTAFVNPQNVSPHEQDQGYFTDNDVLDNVPDLLIFLGTIYASMQFIGCCLLFKPPNGSSSSRLLLNQQLSSSSSSVLYSSRTNLTSSDHLQQIYDKQQQPQLQQQHKQHAAKKILSPTTALVDHLEPPPLLVGHSGNGEVEIKKAVTSREFIVLFMVFGLTTQGILFINAMVKVYGQTYIEDDMYLAWTGSMTSIANSAGRLFWGLAIDMLNFTQCFTSITIIFTSMMFILPFKFVLTSKVMYLVCVLGIYGSFSGWMSTYPVHLARVFGRVNAGTIYGLIFLSQSTFGIGTAFGTQYIVDHYDRFVPIYCVVCLEILGLFIYHMFYQKRCI